MELSIKFLEPFYYEYIESVSWRMATNEARDFNLVY